MAFGRRLYDILRSQVGYYARRAGDRAGLSREDDHLFDESFVDEQSTSKEPRAKSKAEAFERAYRLLELPYGSGPDEVRKAHRRLLRQFHPDRFARNEDGLQDATHLSQELTAARDLLLAALEDGSIRPRS